MDVDNQRMCFKSHKLLLPLELTIATTTGAHFRITVSGLDSVIGLKYALARKFRLLAGRTSLLYKDRLLLAGTLADNDVRNGGVLTIVPSMETGSHNMTTNSRVMQALENLSESQVNDFLTGRAPLLLAMKLGEHMMFVQLQLSNSSCSSRRRTNHTHCAHGNSNGSHSNNTSSEKCNPSPNSGLNSCNSGAVIDSVNHLGQGVYSGKFSGTLDPTIQDPAGRPKRDINTILQILNDLLVASPQFRESGGSCFSSDKNFSPPCQQPVLDTTRSYNDNSGDANLRGKVKTLKRMMEERKLRRQEKRGLRAPYQWPNKLSHVYQRMKARENTNYESAVKRDLEMAGKSESHPESSSSFQPSSSAPMEQESVLV
ncbi:midnolin-like [Mya arenaria]|nr:midnolin-like [Mya arenaria]